MPALLASVAAYTVVLTLLVSTAEHLSRPAALARALAAHRVLPAPVALAAVAIAGEGLLAGAGIVALLHPAGEGLLVAVLVGSAALLALYAGYGLHVRATGRAGSCGCSRVELPMTGWVVARASVLAGLALVALLLSGSTIAADRADASLAVVLLASATFTALLWHLPAAMYEPATATAGRPTAGRSIGTTEGGLPG
ncbi:MauE/DoxX family redox-associated membrane protein [Micromonospora sp. CPCC 205546]|uniref:MauE/DoxX family redox-associated membrane protein n=1 Tax=Micromonospora sp. CPCC 205546 TaxID=3122397 RepID=UPI002FF015D5